MRPHRTREAAALLAALHPTDRRWILARLPDDAATAVAALIPALKALGPVPHAWAREMLDATRTGGGAPPAPATLVAVLDALSPTWAARLLAAAAPDHESLYAAACAPARAMALQGTLDLHRGPLPPRLAQFLAQELQSRARTLEHAGPAASVRPDAAA